MIVRLTALYVAIFAAVLAVISWVGFWLAQTQARGLLAPAIGTPEYDHVLAGYMRHIALTIAGADVPLLVVVGIVAYALARWSLRPLIQAREREARFAADAAHEMRSPLATIATVAQAARLGADDATKPALDTIVQTALEASALIGDLLTLARDPRPAILQREPVDLANVVRACANELDARARERGVALIVRAQSAIVDGDERRLRELARNLLDNALRHARAAVTIRSAAERGESVLEVTDDGEGVPPELRARLFERFFHSRSDGSGLGLAIAHWVASAHAGSLSLGPGLAGATFTARFPTKR